ncbi:PDZ domain-containing protein, partial [Klebsiella pneumoniae]|nr:PDZ domain-containing protein [Klebsiella pneumoniae]
SMQEKIADETRPAYFAARNDGLVVLDTIPNTIGAELNLLPGEMITKVNGVIPRSAEEFYDALQTKTTGAFCKLEVLDTNG